jgi:hypothetical protein
VTATRWKMTGLQGEIRDRVLPWMSIGKPSNNQWSVVP